MSLFTRIKGSSDDASDSDGSSDETGADADDTEDDGGPSLGQTGPNFMPAKQKELYLTAYRNAGDLSETGVCGACGTTLSPIKAERLFASCKNEDCENHLNETELEAVKRYEDRHGVPEEVESEDEPDPSKAPEDDGESALDGLSDAIDD